MRDGLRQPDAGTTVGTKVGVSIDNLREEALRQLTLMTRLLNAAQSQGLVEAPAAQGASRATLDTDSIAATFDILADERSKLDNLEMVLAVVGPMKAGKSTTINAIVGAEVLPNRNRAMTALPTLIRHTPGATRPRLLLAKTEPLNKLISTLRRTLKSRGPDVWDRLATVHETDVEVLRNRVRRSLPFVGRYEGEEAVYAILKELNDVARLCVELNVRFPFRQYAGIETLPTIEVEFAHLSSLPATQGRLALLDTPGPNEAGQLHLGRMLTDQLSRSSAVLAVLDYGQLRSDADAQVREHLLDVAETMAGRIHVLVNKFQADRNSDSEESTRHYVAHRLLKGTVPDENVFPGSAMRAFLASRARHAIQQHRRLDVREGWVRDFLELALGVTWEADAVNDELLMKRAADALWQRSGFAHPLSQVIDVAYRSAASVAVCSAISKLHGIARDTGDFFKAHVGAYKRSTKELQESIDALERDSEAILSMAATTGDALGRALRATQRRLDAAAGDMERGLHQVLGEFFTHGTLKAQGASSVELTGPRMKFTDAAQAESFLHLVEKSVRTVMHESEQAFRACLEAGIDEFAAELDRHRADAMEHVSRSVQQSIEGFDIVIPLPRVNSIALDMSVADVLGQAISEKTERVTRKRRKPGIWGTLCSWFNTDDWGWETYKVDTGYFEVDLDQVRRSSLAGASVLAASARHVLENDIQPQLRNAIQGFFDAYRLKVSHVRGDLLSALENHKGDRARQIQALEEYAKLARQAADLETDCAELLALVGRLRRDVMPVAAASEV
ncbi:hypothetical protein G5B41_02910 [bacterium SGD-2]|nr:hypothetical protein [bacterium SGD-2]